MLLKATKTVQAPKCQSSVMNYHFITEFETWRVSLKILVATAHFRSPEKKQHSLFKACTVGSVQVVSHIKKKNFQFIFQQPLNRCFFLL